MGDLRGTAVTSNITTQAQATRWNVSIKVKAYAWERNLLFDVSALIGLVGLSCIFVLQKFASKENNSLLKPHLA
jgi:hypothetical protein